MKADDFGAEVKFSGRISLLDQAAFITCISTRRLAQGCAAGSCSQPHCFTVLLPHSYQPAFHRPYCLPLNSLTSFNAGFTKLLKLYIPDRTVGKVLQQIPSFPESCSLPAECPSIRGLCSNIQNKPREPRSTPVLPPPRLSKNSCLPPCMGRWGCAAQQWEAQQSLLGDSKTSPSSPESWWEAAHVEEREDVPSAQRAVKANRAPSQRGVRISLRFVTEILFLLALAASLAQCSKKKPHLPFIAVETGWETDLPLSWNWKDFKTSHFQKVYKGWDFESVLREAKNLSEINGN